MKSKKVKCKSAVKPTINKSSDTLVTILIDDELNAKSKNSKDQQINGKPNIPYSKQ